MVYGLKNQEITLVRLATIGLCSLIVSAIVLYIAYDSVNLKYAFVGLVMPLPLIMGTLSVYDSIYEKISTAITFYKEGQSSAPGPAAGSGSGTGGSGSGSGAAGSGSAGTSGPSNSGLAFGDCYYGKNKTPIELDTMFGQEPSDRKKISLGKKVYAQRKHLNNNIAQSIYDDYPDPNAKLSLEDKKYIARILLGKNNGYSVINEGTLGRPDLKVFKAGVISTHEYPKNTSRVIAMIKR